MMIMMMKMMIVIMMIMMVLQIVQVVRDCLRDAGLDAADVTSMGISCQVNRTNYG